MANFTNNTTQLQNLLTKVNNLPEASSGAGFPNGTEWTQSNLVGVNADNVINANGIWVAGTDNGLYYSIDGKTWTQSNITSNVNTLGNAMGLWVANVGDDFYKSIDGKVWSQISIPQTEYAFGIASFNGLWYFLGSESGLYYSTDCQTWIQAIGSGSFMCIGELKGRLVISGMNIETGEILYYYSTDGKTWIKSDTEVNEMSYAIYEENGICFVDTDGSLYYSFDGETWNQLTQYDSDGSYPIYGNGLWVMGTYGKVLYSTDFITWHEANVPGRRTGFMELIYENGIWLFADIYTLYYSIDGKNWSPTNFTEHASLYHITYANGIWLYINSDKGIWYSTDGKIWQPTNIDNYGIWDVTNANGIWISYGQSGLFYSVTWEPT